MTANPVPLVISVDVDETLVRNYGRSRIPIPAVIRHVRALHAQGAELYCWSSGGAAYARQSARECGLEACFQAYLPKPQVFIDDQHISDWRRLVHVLPLGCGDATVAEYRDALKR
ncbi:DUF705 domain-containing protein [Deinococcus arenicola]|uniref:DUF705 domain-containing protein n=1 Tax=Deinococcus arenicola TaxID=2994950 RepID=A0ABU4DM99_9DEIO|nr:DUF705 domain-containing protein [Deinococcus sp. ZS9-10]MDV6373560.1 DUF705 domain-containing protein [Deinococcus sp. ZS9-10]